MAICQVSSVTLCDQIPLRCRAVHLWVSEFLSALLGSLSGQPARETVTIRLLPLVAHLPTHRVPVGQQLMRFQSPLS